MQLANAGHLPPYRNGEMMEVPGSLPLGLAAGHTYQHQTANLHAGDHLIFLTDGVLEARYTSGHLLGFERMDQLARLSPQAIATAAIDFGQDDDITVLGVTLESLGVTPSESLSSILSSI